MIVVDTNIIVHFLLTSAGSEVVVELYRHDPEWCAPLLWRSELSNALAAMVRAHRLELDDAYDVAQRAETMMDAGPYSVATAQVLQRAAASGCTAYDCEFVVLAEQLEVPLVTMDKQVLAAFSELARTPERHLKLSRRSRR